jgi:hypothetical protein
VAVKARRGVVLHHRHRTPVQESLPWCGGCVPKWGRWEAERETGWSWLVGLLYTIGEVCVVQVIESGKAWITPVHDHDGFPEVILHRSACKQSTPRRKPSWKQECTCQWSVIQTTNYNSQDYKLQLM